MVEQTRPRVVALGGGNGTSRLLQALTPLLVKGKIASLHALVLNADDGGSTGRLREQYNVSAMGDLTKCLVALSGFRGDIRGEQFLAALDHRFDRGDFAGHTLRNMFLTALERTSDIDSGIAMMARILQLPQNAGVVPTTLKPLTQQVVVTMSGRDELLGEGQHFIAHNVNLQSDPAWRPGDVRVTFAEGDQPLNPRAAELLRAATHIIIAPGHTYGTIIPTLALPALGRELSGLSARLIVVMTLLTTPRQTTGWRGEDFVAVYQAYLKHAVDTVLANTARTKVALVPQQEWVTFGKEPPDYRLIAADLVSLDQLKQPAADTVPRAIVVHDAGKLTTHLDNILY